MKLLSSTLAACAVAMIVVVPSAWAGDAPPSDTCVARSASSLAALAAGDYADASTHFSAKLGKKLDAGKLRQAWTELQASAGDYRSHATPARRQVQGKPMVIAPIVFAKTPMDLVTLCDAQDDIDAYQFVSASMIDLLEKSRPAEPVKAHVEANGVRVTPMTVASPPGPLEGVLTLPAGKGPFPAVVLVAGSGANDFDETIGPNKPFRDIAEGLAEAGIASLRYNKRTHDYPKTWGEQDGMVIDAEVTDDAVTAAQALAKVAQVDPARVFVLGHSLGAMMAPRIGQRDPQLAGLILLAAPTRSLLDVLIQQSREQSQRMGLSAESVKKGIAAIGEEKRLLAAATPDKLPEGKFMRAPQSWWLSLRDYHQVEVAKSLSMPLLFLQGGADFQVSPTLDFARWKQQLGDKSQASFHLYPGLSHLFMPAGKTNTVADYATPGHVDAKVIDDIASWIKAQ